MEALTHAAQLRLLQLGSAALPIGAFAYSQGLEQAVLLGDVRDRASAAAWICGVLEASVLALDIPIFARLHRAAREQNGADLRRWNERLFCSRGTRELRAEERQVGAALARLLARQGVAAAEPWQSDAKVTLGTSFALASAAWGVPLTPAALGYSYAWLEAQVGAATRLVPLGQSDAQQVLADAVTRAASGVEASLARSEDEILPSAPGQAVLSALHETQYSRLFRS